MSLKIKFNEKNNKQILQIEFNNIDKNNALSLDMLDSMIFNLSNTSFINKFKCIIITGTNKSPFSAGADLTDIKKLIEEKNLMLYHSKMNTLLQVMSELEIPIVSLIRSYCFGAGLILALYSDILFATEETIFCIPAAKLNIKIPENQIAYLKKKNQRKLF